MLVSKLGKVSVKKTNSETQREQAVKHYSTSLLDEYYRTSSEAENLRLEQNSDPLLLFLRQFLRGNGKEASFLLSRIDHLASADLHQGR
jgi:DNA-binding protein Fis